VHAALGCEPLDDLGVALRPRAARSPRRVALQVGGIVPAASLAVDPAVAQRLLERLVTAHTRRPLLGGHEPDAGAVAVVLFQPRAPRRAIAKREDLFGHRGWRMPAMVKPIPDDLRTVAPRAAIRATIEAGR
jgi:hypothetical protein